jgi:hypothetical protein
MSDGRLLWSSCGKQLCVCKWLKIWRKISLINYVMFHACGMPSFCIFPSLLPIGCLSVTVNYWGPANCAGDISYLFLGGWGSMLPPPLFFLLVKFRHLVNFKLQLRKILGAFFKFIICQFFLKKIFQSRLLGFSTVANNREGFFELFYFHIYLYL